MFPVSLFFTTFPSYFSFRLSFSFILTYLFVYFITWLMFLFTPSLLNLFFILFYHFSFIPCLVYISTIFTTSNYYSFPSLSIYTFSPFNMYTFNICSLFSSGSFSPSIHTPAVPLPSPHLTPEWKKEHLSQKGLIWKPLYIFLTFLFIFINFFLLEGDTCSACPRLVFLFLFIGQIRVFFCVCVYLCFVCLYMLAYHCCCFCCSYIFLVVLFCGFIIFLLHGYICVWVFVSFSVCLSVCVCL